MPGRNEKIANSVKEIAAQFLVREDNKTSLITVTSASVSPDFRNGTIFITVLPTSLEAQALHFVERRLGDIRQEIAKNLPIKIIPYLHVEIDQGEKNRQKIDELLRNS